MILTLMIYDFLERLVAGRPTGFITCARKLEVEFPVLAPTGFIFVLYPFLKGNARVSPTQRPGHSFLDHVKLVFLGRVFVYYVAEVGIHPPKVRVYYATTVGGIAITTVWEAVPWGIEGVQDVVHRNVLLIVSLRVGKWVGEGSLT